MSIPTEAEITATAAELGLLDASGRYPRERRTQLAKVAVLMRDAPDDGAEPPEQITTARALSRFHDELLAENFAGTAVHEAIGRTVSELVRRDGLVLAPIPTTTEENR